MTKPSLADYEASLIAYEMLMPTQAIHDFFKSSWWRKAPADPMDDNVIIKLSQKLGVPIAAVVMRLRNLGYYDYQFEIPIFQNGGKP